MYTLTPSKVIISFYIFILFIFGFVNYNLILFSFEILFKFDEIFSVSSYSACDFFFIKSLNNINLDSK